MTPEERRIECKKQFDNCYSVVHDSMGWSTWKTAFDRGVIFGSQEDKARIAELEKDRVRLTQLINKAFWTGFEEVRNINYDTAWQQFKTDNGL